MFRKALIAMAIAGLTVAAGCTSDPGGVDPDSGLGQGNNGGSSTPAPVSAVEGPLDRLQDPLGNQVIAPL